MAKLKVITFDLDNTLWDVDSVIVSAEQRMRVWLANKVPEFSTRFPQEKIVDLRNELIASHPDIRHDLSKLREEILFLAISRCGYSQETARTYASDAFEVFFDARHEVVFFDGALDMLEALSKRYQLGALTNGNADFTKLQLDRYFSFGFSSATVGAAKPAPQMFQAALQHTRVTADESVHIGDHPVDDIQGAASVGMHTVWVNFGQDALPPGTTQPTFTVNRLQDISQVVEQIPNLRGDPIA